MLSWAPGSPATRYDLAGGFLSDLAVTGDTSLATCQAEDLNITSWTDTRPEAPSGDAYYYLVRGDAVCAGSYGSDSGGLERPTPAACP